MYNDVIFNDVIMLVRKIGYYLPVSSEITTLDHNTLPVYNQVVN